MPIFEIRCAACGYAGEVIQVDRDEPLICPSCGAAVSAELSPTSSLTGKGGGQRLPGPGDTCCCGSSPEHAGCAGPGSCCGRSGH